MNEQQLPADPMSLFEKLYHQAVQQCTIDATAMVISTVSADNRPSSRVVLLKNYSHEGFTFFTNYQSRKSGEIQATGNVALCFYWAQIDVQIRIEGTASRTSEAVSDEYFATRPRVSQLGAWASDQSRKLNSRQELVDRLDQFTQRYEGLEVPRPPHWGGYLVTPSRIEFWFNGQFRLHDRYVYSRSTVSSPWTTDRLNP